jgi:hypothetical protein
LPDRVAEDLGDQLLVGGPVEHLPAVAVLDPQHLLAVVVVAPGLLPQIGRLDGRHEHFLGAAGVLLVAHDLFDPLQHPQAQGQPGIDPGAGLADHAGAQHETVRDDLRLGGRLLHGRQEISGQTHVISQTALGKTGAATLCAAKRPQTV